MWFLTFEPATGVYKTPPLKYERLMTKCLLFVLLHEPFNCALHSNSRPAKLSKVHFSRKFQGKMHLNFWLSGSPISPYFHPKNLPIPPKVYLLKVQGTKSKANYIFLKQICGIFVLKICFLGMLVYVTYQYLKCISKFIQQQIFIWW